MSILMIVESPNKAKKIKSYFPEFQVVATLGHIQDLPLKDLGVSAEGHKPHWVAIEKKGDAIKRIRGAAKGASTIYVATDPDREGEAIAAHIVNLLGRQHASKCARITYTEISKKAITQAIQNKRSVDWPLVRAQEARRVLDRYVGYLVSPELTNKLKPFGLSQFLSAGRVQSVALRLIVERQIEIEQFVPVEHFGVRAHLAKLGINFSADWHPGLPKGERVLDRAVAQAVVDRTSQVVVVDVKVQDRAVPPPKPLITSSYVRLMGGVLKLTTKQAMDAAQKLFEAGLITYHRTDSTDMSADFAAQVHAFAEQRGLPLPRKGRSYRARANAQQGHECLRVTDIAVTGAAAGGVCDSLLQAVYQWIWRVTLESQLADGADRETLVWLQNPAADRFVARAREIAIQGWRGVCDHLLGKHREVEETKKDGEGEERVQAQLPALAVGDVLTPEKVELLAKITTPPKPYSEKTLVEKLDKLGIGRPSTYAQTIERLVAMAYVTREARTLRLDPTVAGRTVVRMLRTVFSFMQYEYTATLEEDFDRIAQSKAEYFPVVDQAFTALQAEIARFRQVPVADAVKQALQRWHEVPARQAPESAPSKNAKAPKAKKTPAKESETRRPRTAKPSRAKAAPKAQPVSDSPTCTAGSRCPSCGKGVVVEKTLQKGKNAGAPFFGCSLFPQCDYFQWQRVSG